MKNAFKILMLISFVGLFSCSETTGDEEKPQDIIAPQLEILTPTANAELLGGGEFVIDCMCSDNTELSMLKVSVSEATSTQALLKSVDEPWAPMDKEYELQGQEMQVNEVFDVLPELLKAGEYEVMFTLLDAAGNKKQKSVVVDILM